MSRLSIDLTPEQHQKIKAVAALQGKSIKEYVLAQILPTSSDENMALSELEMLLDERIKSCLLYTSPSPRDRTRSRMPSSA